MWDVDDILNMPIHKRKRLRLGRKRGRYVMEKRRSFSREELISFLKQNNYRTRDALRKGRSKGEPACSDYKKEFGSWGDAKREAFGQKVVTDKERAKFMMDAVIMHELWTWKKYQAARKEALKRGMPDAIPSLYEVEKIWGSYLNLRQTARMASAEKTFESYLKLWRRLGRKPDMADCDRHRLNIKKAIDCFGSKKEMDSILEVRV